MISKLQLKVSYCITFLYLCLKSYSTCKTVFFMAKVMAIDVSFTATGLCFLQNFNAMLEGREKRT